MNVKHTLMALVTGATVIGCVATAAHATGPLSATPTSSAAPLTASGTQGTMTGTGTQRLAGELTRSTRGARFSGEAGDDGSHATGRHTVLGDEAAHRHVSVSGRTPAVSASGTGTGAAGEIQDA